MPINRLYTRSIIATLAGVVLSGCVSLTPPTLSKQQTDYKKSAPLTRQQKLRALKSWNISGAVSVKQPQRSFIARYTWRQNNGHYTIGIHSNLDLASVKLVGSRSRVTLSSSDGKVVKSNNLNALMQQQLGWRLPVNNLTYWIRSLPAPGSNNTQYNKLGQTKKIQQSGWTVTYSRYQRINGLELPTLMNVSGRDLQLRIVVKQWDA
ncbi:MAG: lipoprotein insertase outer membrane protein LolB [Coxiellaceae bacterium]|nr:lipoprotein insertase outer membrane protein LolB [Coxiellaceae bacterium]